MTQSPKASSQPADYERAAAELCKRVGNGFGVSDHAKFAGWCAEVTKACKGFSPAEIEEAADELMRMQMRPNIGEVYRALAAAGRRADLHERARRPALPPPVRKGLTSEQIAAIKARVDARFNDRERNLETGEGD